MTFSFNDLSIERVVELEVPFADALSFLPGLQPEILAEPVVVGTDPDSIRMVS